MDNLASFLQKWDRPVPRYTSYPTAPQFHRMQEEVYLEKLKAFDAEKKPLSLYCHIPFCTKMCLFCGCSVVLNRVEEKQQRYCLALQREVEKVTSFFQKKKHLRQLHFGGGTPTSLTLQQFEALLSLLRRKFLFDEGMELSIEIDPRTVFLDRGEKLRGLKKLGFNRVSFGVQDLDPKVQEAVKRRQTEEMSRFAFDLARELGFLGINIDLIYGLPYQTVERFSKTAEAILTMRPDRIAFYSYARVPWIKPHQKAIPDSTLPDAEEKLKIYVRAKELFEEGGYVSIGMDHFALKEDPLALCYSQGGLTRNFQGYAVEATEDLLGLGMSSIGFVSGAFFQNAKNLEEYYHAVDGGGLPIQKGLVLSEEDHLRRTIILELMCRFAFEKERVKDFDLRFAKEVEALKELEQEGLVLLDEEQIRATEKGQLVIRIIASVFDTYFSQGRYSKAI